MKKIIEINELDRFINGEIDLDEIQSFPLQQDIKSVIKYASYFYKEVEHHLYEKLCYAAVLHFMHDYDHEELYAIYLFAKGKCFPHKLDWDGLVESIKRKSGINDRDIVDGTRMYEKCQKKGGYYSDLLPVDYYVD